MRLFFLLISCVVFCTASANVDGNLFPQVAGKKCEYTTEIQFKGNSVTGICILKHNDKEIIGAIINEFGIKVFDFIVRLDGLKVKLENVTPFLDKWYIKRMLKKDLKFLFTHLYKTPQKSRRREVSQTANTLVLKNIKYGITYCFTSIERSLK